MTCAQRTDMRRRHARRGGNRILILLLTIAAMMGRWFEANERHSTQDAPSRRSTGGSVFVAAQSTNCTQLAPLITGNRTVNIAMLFWGPPANDTRFTVNGAARIRWPRNPILEGWDGPSSVEIRFMRPYLLWEERMELPAAYGGGPGLILLDGSVMRLNVSWFNLGEYRTLRGPGEFTPQYQNSWANTLIKQLADVNGPYGHQHFILSPLISNSQVTILASLACEASGTCMMVSPGAAESRQFICQDPMPQDCLQRGRRKGSRRFENTVSAYSNADYWASGSMSLVVNQGFKRIFAIGELWSVNAMTQMSATAKLLGMQVVGSLLIATQTKDWRDYNTSSAALTQRIKDLRVDMVVVLNTFEGTTALHDLLRHWRAINFLPNAVAYLTGGASYLPPDLAAYFLVEVHWLPTLTGAQYRAVSTETNFETFPANATHDSPIVFADAFTERFGYRPSNQVFFDSVRALHAVTIVQKLLELAQTEDTESLKQAAARIAAPAVYHAVQFDQWGRSLPFDNFVMQLMPDGEARVLTPLGLGTTPVLPIPGWDEREYKPVFLAKTSERVAFSLAAVTVLYLLGWLVWLISQRHHPLIRVADPLSSGLSLCGLLVLVSSCFFTTFLQSDTTCAAFMWLFMLGLTLAFAPLMLKNLRIYSLWRNSSSLSPSPIKQWHMLLVLILRLLVDVLILAIWLADTGMTAHRHSPDPYRPSMDYYSCDFYEHSRGYAFALFAWKFLVFALAMVLAYLLRDVAAKYSESRFIALCVYNVTVTLAIFVPVSATDAAGPEGTQLVRVYLILFLCISTASIMLLPKFLAIRRSAPPTLIASWSRKDKTQAETQSPSPLDAAKQQTATEIRAANTSVVHSAHFPGGAPVPTQGQGLNRVVNLRGPEWQQQAAQRHDSLPFQSMIGLSQVERRCVDEESDINHSRAPRPQQAHQATRVPGRHQQRRPPGVGTSSPAPLLDAIPQSARGSPPSHSPPSSDVESPAALLKSTLDLIHMLPSDEVAQLHSSLLRRRHSTPISVSDPHPPQSHSHPSHALSVRLPPLSIASVPTCTPSTTSGPALGSGSSGGSGASSGGSADSIAPLCASGPLPPTQPPVPRVSPSLSLSHVSAVQFAAPLDAEEQMVVSFYEE